MSETDESREMISIEIRLAGLLERMTEATESLAAQPRNGGFWAKIGPYVMTLLLALNVPLLGYVAKGHIELQRVYEVHLQRPHGTVEDQLAILNAFMRKGNRYSHADGDRQAQISQQLVSACRESDPKSKIRLLDQIDQDLAAFRTRR